MSLLKVHSQQEGAFAEESIIDVKNFKVFFNDLQVLKNINLSFPQNSITCIIGPSGGGKSTLLRSLNRINDEVEGFSCQGELILENENVYDKKHKPEDLRAKVGMVFQRPCVFPKSIAENVLFGLSFQKKLSRQERAIIVEESLRAVGLWSETSHRLKSSATSLSIGQQQRLCIARTITVKPKVLLLDEPTSSLDPVSALAIEKLMLELKKEYSIIFVTHNIQQASRIADNIVFLCDGKVIEAGPKSQMFENPSNEKTRSYLNSEFCDC
ncbi:MAG: phosphate transport system ATP-binding protein [Sphingobacteriales bacterium]|jgi:phosphate transport system ATP-binding protein